MLDCTASGGPPPTISWTRNGIPISAAFSRFHVASNGSLILTNLTRADEGNYTCMAVNQAGTSVSPFFLEINEQIVMGSTSATALVLAGASVQMEDTTSIKGFAILWQHRGKVVHESNVVKVESNGSLTISTARLEDAGHYKCLVATSRGWRETDFLLHVEPKRGKTSATVNEVITLSRCRTSFLYIGTWRRPPGEEGFCNAPLQSCQSWRGSDTHPLAVWREECQSDWAQALDPARQQSTPDQCAYRRGRTVQLCCHQSVWGESFNCSGHYL